VKPSRFNNAFSFRVLLAAIVAGAIPAVAVSLASAPAAWVTFAVVSLATWTWIVLSGQRLVLRCPYCRKGVKWGAELCHHCGRNVYDSRPS
jgi:hypothetical protein